jgi:hypothetical protein
VTFTRCMVTPLIGVSTTRTAQAAHHCPPLGHGATPAIPTATLPILVGPRALPHL